MAHLNLLQCPKLRRANRWTPSPVNVKDIEMIRKKAIWSPKGKQKDSRQPLQKALLSLSTSHSNSSAGWSRPVMIRCSEEACFFNSGFGLGHA